MEKMFGSGKTPQKKKEKMEEDATRVPLPRGAKTAAAALAIAQPATKVTGNRKGREVNTQFEAELKQIVQMDTDRKPVTRAARPRPVAQYIPSASTQVFVMDKKTPREPMKEKHQASFKMVKPPSREDEEHPQRPSRDVIELTQKLQKLMLKAVPKKLPIKQVTQSLIILDELKKNIVEPIILLNPNEDRLNLISDLLEKSIKYSINDDKWSIKVVQQLKANQIDKVFVEQINNLIDTLETEYNIDANTDVISLFEDYKTSIHRVYERIETHIEQLLGRVTEWRLDEMKKIGKVKDDLSKYKSITPEQTLKYDKAISQFEDSYQLYAEYESGCLTLLEHYQNEHQTFIEKHIDVYTTDKRSKVNLYKFQEYIPNLLIIKNNLEAFLRKVQEAKNKTAAKKAETRDALDDILAMFGTATKMGGRRKKRVTKKK